MIHRLISESNMLMRDGGIHAGYYYEISEVRFNSLPELDTEGIIECLDALLVSQHPINCGFCNKDSYYAKHDSDCVITKAKHILAQLRKD